MDFLIKNQLICVRAKSNITHYFEVIHQDYINNHIKN